MKRHDKSNEFSMSKGIMSGDEYNTTVHSSLQRGGGHKEKGVKVMEMGFKT